MSKQPSNVCANGHAKELHERCKECVKGKNKQRYILHADQQKTQAREYNLSLKGKYTVYKRRAKIKDIEFTLTIEQFASFWQIPCSYCKRDIDTIGIDRIDSSVGYVLVNCASCCTRCNVMKLDQTIEEWKANMIAALNGMGAL